MRNKLFSAIVEAVILTDGCKSGSYVTAHADNYYVQPADQKVPDRHRIVVDLSGSLEEAIGYGFNNGTALELAELVYADYVIDDETPVPLREVGMNTIDDVLSVLDR